MLTKKEQKETIDITIGRIRGLATNVGSERLRDLINKVSDDLDKIRFPESCDENYVIAGIDFGENIKQLNVLTIRKRN